MKYLLLLLLLSSVQAATLHGTIYDMSLEKAQSTIVEIDSAPLQRMVAVNGTYAFEVPSGTYTLSAYYQGTDGVHRTQENVTVTEEGTYVFDLFLYPTLEEEKHLYEEIEFDVQDPYGEGNDGILIIGLAAALACLGVLLYMLSRTKNHMEDLDEDLANILSLLEKNQGRMTQKQIRSHLSHSEAKVSLMLSELENLDKVRRYKKGRGNIVKLK